MVLLTAVIEPVGVLPAGAHVSATSGDVVSINGSLPAGVQECGTTGVTSDNSANCLGSSRALHQISAFDEVQSFTLPADLAVDFGPRSSNWALGTTYSTETEILGHSYSLLAGDTVSSHLLHTDLPFADAALTPSQRTGTATFGSPIYGLIITDGRLGATDSLKAAGVTYPTVDTNRGFEFDCVGTSVFTGIACSPAYNAFVDSFSVPTASTLSVDESVTNGMDQTRVLTNVPDAPTITCPGPVAVSVGEIAHASGGTFADADSFPTVTISASRGTVTQVGTGRTGTWSWDLDTSLSLGSGPVTVTATDDAGVTGTCSFNLTVNEVVSQLVPPGGSINVGGAKATPDNPTVATAKTPRTVPAANAKTRAALSAFANIPAPSATIKMALIPVTRIPDCLDETGHSLCSGALVGIDPGPLFVSKRKPIKLTMLWDKSVLTSGTASTLWVTKPIPGTTNPGPTVPVPRCVKVAKEYINTPCTQKTSFPGGDFKTVVLLLSTDPRFRCR